MPNTEHADEAAEKSANADDIEEDVKPVIEDEVCYPCCQMAVLINAVQDGEVSKLNAEENIATLEDDDKVTA